MIRTLTASGFALALSLQATAPVADTDLPRYALTQGGLLAVVLVLLWSYRKDALNTLKDRDDALVVMTKMVSDATAAQTKTAEAVDRMARAIETLQGVQLRDVRRNTEAK